MTNGHITTMYQGGQNIEVVVCECGTVGQVRTHTAEPIPYIISEYWCPACNAKIEGFEGRVTPNP